MQVNIRSDEVSEISGGTGGEISKDEMKRSLSALRQRAGRKSRHFISQQQTTPSPVPPLSRNESPKQLFTESVGNSVVDNVGPNGHSPLSGPRRVVSGLGSTPSKRKENQSMPLSRPSSSHVDRTDAAVSNPWMVGLGSPLSMRVEGLRSAGSPESSGPVCEAGSNPSKRLTEVEDESFPLHASIHSSKHEMYPYAVGKRSAGETLGGDHDNSFVLSVPEMEDVLKEDILFIRPAVISSRSNPVTNPAPSVDYGAALQGRRRSSSSDGSDREWKDETTRSSAGVQGSRGIQFEESTTSINFLKSYLVNLERDFVAEYGRMEYDNIMRK